METTWTVTNPPSKAASGGDAPASGTRVLDLAGLDRLLAAILAEGYLLVGPTVKDGAVVLAPISSSRDLPRGLTDVQDPGRYQLQPRGDGALFGYAVGPHSLKGHLFVPRLTLAELRRVGRSFESAGAPSAAPKVAVLGARACDLAAAAIQDRVFLGGAHVDPDYEARREALLIVSVQCGVSAPTCFCASMGSGPRAGGGFDLALTELLEPTHHFVLEVGSPRGEAITRALEAPVATPEQIEASLRLSEEVARSQTRRVDPEAARQVLASRAEHPRWDDVARRCLSCGNCTLVCPTCFCSTVEDVTDLSGDLARRERRWDSCFTLEHSYVHGGPVRPSTAARYRQWLTHKLSTWHEQFGTAGCVGCGRCVTWCPAGIDLLEEVRALTPEGGHG